DHDVERFGGDQVPSRFTAGCDTMRVFFHFEDGFQQITDCLVVIDDENSGFHKNTQSEAGGVESTITPSFAKEGITFFATHVGSLPPSRVLPLCGPNSESIT